MIDSPKAMPTGSLLDEKLAGIVQSLIQQLQAGNTLDLDECAKQYPEYEDQLRQLWPTVEAMMDLASSVPGGTRSLGEMPALAEGQGVLGDFRLIREIGRGGMGVVYEAQQISLKRRVALKVLPMAGMLDPRQLQRFQNEAQAAASLHHTNIVPVFSVGCERGVHYYAMQYIDGRSLSEVIAELRKASQPTPPKEKAPLSERASQLFSERKEPSSDNPAEYEPTVIYQPGSEESSGNSGLIVNQPSKDPVTTNPLAALSTQDPARSQRHPARNREYIRNIAQLTIQIAEALDYAHSLGITHRDIKPSNLLLDGRGTVWIADFGLAQVGTEGNLTLTGEMLGTLRYMSPEQATGQRGVLDHCTDIYSLGITLYELVTLHPAFPGTHRQELLRQVMDGEPRPPRQVNPAIPRELETIVLKATAKESAGRYATAQDLADDLRRFLADEPIRAQRPRFLEHVRKFIRRHRPAVVATASALVLVGCVVAFLFLSSARERAARYGHLVNEVYSALQEASRLRGQAQQAGQDLGKWSAALSAARRAQALLPEAADEDLRRRVEPVVTDLEGELKAAEVRLEQAQRNQWMRAELDRIQLEQASVKDGRFDSRVAIPLYATAFEQYGIDVLKLKPAEAAAQINARAIRADLIAAVDDWAHLLREDPQGRHLWAVARAADPGDPWRTRLRNAIQARDEAALAELADVETMLQQHPAHIRIWANPITENGPTQESVAVLRTLQRRHPDDFWINYHLARQLLSLPEPPWHDVIRFYGIAVALRPGSPGAWVNLGYACHEAGLHDEAIAAAREAIRLKPDYAKAYMNLGLYLFKQGHLDESTAAFREAIRLKPEFAHAYCNLAANLGRQGHLDEAIAAAREAIRLKPDYAEAYFDLGLYLGKQGHLDEAIAAFREAIRLKPDDAEAYHYLGFGLAEQGRLDEAIAAAREAIRLKPDYAKAYHNFGVYLDNQGHLDQAVAAFREAIRLKPDDAVAHQSLGITLFLQGQLEQAIAAYREAIRLKPDFAEAYHNLGVALAQQAHLDEAIAAFREAIRLKPDDAEAHYHLGNNLYRRGRVQEAILAYREAIRFKPDDAVAHHSLGITLFMQGQLEQAILAYREAIRLKPDFAEAYHNLGVALAEQGRLDEAIAAAREAIRLKPDYAKACRNFGVYLGKQGHLDEAVAAFREAIRLKPDDARAYCDLADNLVRQGHLDEAIAASRKAIRLNLTQADCYNLACVYSLASRSAQKQPELSEQYAARATELLKQSIEKGWRDLSHIKSDPDLAPLRPRSDFQEVIRKLEQQLETVPTKPAIAEKK